MKEPKNTKKTDERKLFTKLPKPNDLINKEQQKDESANELHKGHTHKHRAYGCNDSCLATSEGTEPTISITPVGCSNH